MSERIIPRRTQAERTRRRKEKVIKEAIHFFGQHGFHGASLAEIAEASGITEPGLLHHYPSKEQLLMEVLAERDRIDRKLFNLSTQAKSSDLLVSLHELVLHNESVPGLVLLFTVLVAESIDEQHPGHEFFMQRYRNLRDQNIEAIKKEQAQGGIRKDIAAEDLAILLFAMMDGLQIQWLYEPDSINMAGLFEQFLGLSKGNQEIPVDVA